MVPLQQRAVCHQSPHEKSVCEEVEARNGTQVFPHCNGDSSVQGVSERAIGRRNMKIVTYICVFGIEEGVKVK